MRVAAFYSLLCVALAGCTDSPHSQEQVRRQTAAATATIKSDLKGAALGIRDGLKQKPAGAVDINTASEAELTALPGVTATMAAGIVAHRPYKSSTDLRTRHILPKAVYDNVAGRLTTSH